MNTNHSIGKYDISKIKSISKSCITYDATRKEDP